VKLSPAPSALRAASAAVPGAAQQRVKGLRTGLKRPRELLLAQPEPKRPRELPVGHVMASPGLAAVAASPGGPSGLLAVDLSGLDLLLRASEARHVAVLHSLRTAADASMSVCVASQATPLKSPLLPCGRPVPGASPLGQLAHLVAGSPFMPHGWAAKLGGAPKAARKLGKMARGPSGGLIMGAAAGNVDSAVRAATAAVVDLAPEVAVAAAARWLDLLVADIRARHAALRKSRGRLARAHTALADGRATADAAATAALMRQLDGALAGEESVLVARLQQVAEMRALCGAADDAAAATPAQAAASAAALVLTAAALASGVQDPSRTGGSSGSDGGGSD
jgi:hypothetical protein